MQENGFLLQHEESPESVPHPHSAVCTFRLDAALCRFRRSDRQIYFLRRHLPQDGSKSKGIYAYRFDAETAQITELGLVAETTNPSFVVLRANGRFLYAVNEVGNYKSPNSGGVSAFSIDRATGKLIFLNEVPSRGADPCYITVDKTGKYVLVANYTAAASRSFPYSQMESSARPLDD